MTWVRAIQLKPNLKWHRAVGEEGDHYLTACRERIRLAGAMRRAEPKAGEPICLACRKKENG
jgi:hypothetical protein